MSRILIFSLLSLSLSVIGEDYNIVELAFFAKKDTKLNIAVNVDSSSLLKKSRNGIVIHTSGTEVGERIATDLSELNAQAYLACMTNSFSHEEYMIEDLNNSIVVNGAFSISNELERVVLFQNGYKGNALNLLPHLESLLDDSIRITCAGPSVHSILRNREVLVPESPTKLKQVLLEALNDEEIFWYSLSNRIYILDVNSDIEKIPLYSLLSPDKEAEMNNVFKWKEAKSKM